MQCTLTAYLQTLAPISMIDTQFPKFKWEELSEQNSGHTKDEWGIKKQRPKTRKIITYAVIWDNPT